MSNRYYYYASEVKLDALEVIKKGDEKALLREKLHLGRSCLITITRRSLDSRFH